MVSLYAQPHPCLYGQLKTGIHFPTETKPGVASLPGPSDLLTHVALSTTEWGPRCDVCLSFCSTFLPPLEHSHMEPGPSCAVLYSFCPLPAQLASSDAWFSGENKQTKNEKQQGRGLTNSAWVTAEAKHSTTRYKTGATSASFSETPFPETYSTQPVKFKYKDSETTPAPQFNTTIYQAPCFTSTKTHEDSKQNPPRTTLTIAQL